MGDTITYTVTAQRDDGPDAATGVTVQDLLPAGVTFVSDLIPAGGATTPARGPGRSGTSISRRPRRSSSWRRSRAPNPSTNTATISHADQFDPNTGNNTASARRDATGRPTSPLAKAVSNPTPNVGDTIAYTVTVTNNGPNNATSVQVTDLLPAGVSLVDSDTSQGTYQRSTGVWDVGTVTTSVPQTLVLTGTVASPNSVDEHGDDHRRTNQFDPNTANNTASASS